MARPKIAVYTMAKNEADHVQRYAETTRGADAVVVTDTGSTDGTPDLLRDAGIEVYHSNIVPWRFDEGTNAALHHVPADIDVCVKLDLDEIIHMPNGQPWHDEVATLWGTEGFRQMRYWYTWSWHVPGEVPAVRFRTGNIHARDNYIWRHPGHAALCSTKRGSTVDAENLEIHHYMTGKGRPDYLSLLQLAVWEHKCPRTLFYLGREYGLRRMSQESINTLMEYLEHPEANWQAERANAMRIIGLGWERLGDHDRAMTWFMRAIGEYPGVRDLWWEVLRHFCERGDYPGGYWAGIKCLAITDRDRQWIGQTADAWYDRPFVLMARCASQMGKQDEAVRLLQQGLERNPASKEGRELAVMLGVTIR